jgi:hypothetical protein
MIFALILSLTLGPRPGGAAPADPLGLPYYGQEVSIALPAGAEAVSVTVAPLYRDAKWAATQRWDDNRVDSLRVRDLLRRYHMHGTFYLNASDAWYFNEAGYRFEGDPVKDLSKALRQGGHSIGGHSLTHNFMPLLNRQEQFYELLGVRIDREVNSQSPVSSFVFPFTVFRNALEPDAVHHDLAEELRRSGYLHVANQYFNIRAKQPTGILDSWLLPCDGKPTELSVKGLLGSEKQRARAGNFCFCMHAWPGSWGGAALPQLNDILKRWAGRGAWWYANQNELAAYRYQLAHGPLESETAGGALKLSLRRFEPWALGDAVPVTLRLKGFGDAPVASFEGVTLQARRAREKGVWLLELPHSAGHSLPDAYDWHRNPSNKAEGLDEKGKGVLTGLGSRLHFNGHGLKLTLKNKQALSEVQVTWRVPLGWEAPGPSHYDRLSAGQGLNVEAALPVVPDALVAQGRPYFAAQIDATGEDGRRLRLYSDCHAAALPRDPQFPKGGFLVLGPLPGDRPDFELYAFAAKLMRKQRPPPCQSLFGDVQGCWEALPESRLDPLHPELIPAGGVSAPRTFYTWDPTLYYTHGHNLHYLLAGVIESPSSRAVTVQMPQQVKRFFVNGKRVRGRKLNLQAGSNLVTLLYRPGVHDADGQGSFSERNYGPFFRLVDGEGKRLTDIQYQMPAWRAEPEPEPAGVEATQAK